MLHILRSFEIPCKILSNLLLGGDGNKVAQSSLSYTAITHVG